MTDTQTPGPGTESRPAKESDVSRELPEGLQGFNWGAMLVPPIWGVAYGQWAGVFFLPAWAFVDNMIRGSYELGMQTSWLGWTMALATLGLQAGFARTANRIWWHRTQDHAAIERYARHQRLWAVGGVVTLAVMGVWIALFIASGQTIID